MAADLRFLRAIRSVLWVIPLCLLSAAFPGDGHSQELEPGAYSPSPIDFNILVGGIGFNSGDLAFDPSGPIDNASADIGSAFFGYVRTFGLFGRLANAGVVVPYIHGSLRGNYLGEFHEVDRSGFGDPRFRFSINLHGTPAMGVQEFASHQQKWNIGVSGVVSPPLGKYSSDRLINIGSNRWGFKSEVGVTRRIGRWTIEGYLGAWFFTDNTDFNGGGTRTQEPIGSAQFHVIYTIRPRMWIAYDINYYRGGRTSTGSGKNQDLMKNSRTGLTFSMPIGRMQSLKFAYSRGATTSIGADFDAFTVAWQRVWGQ